jgi:stalled ribosome alternative rescue factor ArfA
MQNKVTAKIASKLLRKKTKKNKKGEYNAKEKN